MTKTNKTTLTTVGQKTVEAIANNGRQYTLDIVDNYDSETTKKFFEKLKTKKAWTDSDKIAFARWTVKKFCRNLYVWSNTNGKKKNETAEERDSRQADRDKHDFSTTAEARDYFRQIANTKLCYDYMNIDSFDVCKNTEAVDGVTQESYNLISLVIEFLYNYKVKNWTDFFTRTVSVDVPTKRTFEFLDNVSTVSKEKTLKQLCYTMLNNTINAYKKTTYNHDFVVTQKDMIINGQTETVYEKSFVCDVFSSDYIIAKKGTENIDVIDVSTETTEALDSLAKKGNLTQGEKLAVLFIGYAKLTDSKARKAIKAYTGTDYSLARIRSNFEKGKAKLEKIR